MVVLEYILKNERLEKYEKNKKAAVEILGIGSSPTVEEAQAWA